MTLKKGNFDKIMISSPGNNGINWWFDITTAFNAISMGNSELTLITDASKLGWVLF